MPAKHPLVEPSATIISGDHPMVNVGTIVGRQRSQRKRGGFRKLIILYFIGEHIDILYNYIKITYILSFFSKLLEISNTHCAGVVKNGETIVEYLPQFTIAQLGIWDQWTQWIIPSGNGWQFANLKIAIEIIDLPSYKMVDLSIVM